MARPYKRASGDVVDIASCAAAHNVGDYVFENGFAGVCLQNNLINAANQLQIRGRFRMRVPSSSAQGRYLQMSNTLPAVPANGSLIATISSTNAVLVAAATANTGTLVGQIMDTPSSNVADVLLLPEQSGKI